MELIEINEKQTIKNAKKKLREYPRWREIAHDSAEQRITANYMYQGYVETSNVNVAEELVNMIQVQRAYEINSKAVILERLSI